METKGLFRYPKTSLILSNNHNCQMTFSLQKHSYLLYFCNSCSSHKTDSILILAYRTICALWTCTMFFVLSFRLVLCFGLYLNGVLFVIFRSCKRHCILLYTNMRLQPTVCSRSFFKFNIQV